MFRFNAGRDLGRTELPCDTCGAKISVRRSCHEVWLHCDACGRDFPVTQYAQRMDESLERCLESVYCNRM